MTMKKQQQQQQQQQQLAVDQQCCNALLRISLISLIDSLNESLSG